MLCRLSSTGRWPIHIFKSPSLVRSRSKHQWTHYQYFQVSLSLVRSHKECQRTPYQYFQVSVAGGLVTDTRQCINSFKCISLVLSLVLTPAEGSSVFPSVLSPVLSVRGYWPPHSLPTAQTLLIPLLATAVFNNN